VATTPTWPATTKGAVSLRVQTTNPCPCALTHPPKVPLHPTRPIHPPSREAMEVKVGPEAAGAGGGGTRNGGPVGGGPIQAACHLLHHRLGCEGPRVGLQGGLRVAPVQVHAVQVAAEVPCSAHKAGGGWARRGEGKGERRGWLVAAWYQPPPPYPPLPPHPLPLPPPYTCSHQATPGSPLPLYTE
jgi:hypothetical protein